MGTPRPSDTALATGVTNHVPAGYYGEITAIAPMIRYTGNFAITMGYELPNFIVIF
jgi:hypothetical protein